MNTDTTAEALRPASTREEKARALTFRRPLEEDARRYRQSGLWPSTTLIDDLYGWAEREPRRAAIVSYTRGGTRPSTTTYGQLIAMADRFAIALADLGVEKDDVVSIQVQNGWEFAVAAIGAARAGAIVNPLVTIFRRRELSFMLGRAASSVLVVPSSYRGFDHARLALSLKDELPDLGHVVVVESEGAPVPTGATDFADLIAPSRDRAEFEPALEARRRGTEELASLMYTSGTTGEPKGTLHTYSTLWSAGRAVFDNLGLTDDDVAFMASPMGHLTGYLWGMLIPLSRGMTSVFQDVWDAGRFLDIIADEGITWTIGATPFVVDSVAEQQRSPRTFDTFKTFVCAGAPIPPTLCVQAEEILGAKLFAQWGTSECGGCTIHSREDSVETVADSDGRPNGFMKVRLIDVNGDATPVGSEGRLLVKGPSVFVNYVGRPDLYDEVVSPDGWFDTGDLGVERPDGTIRITGRAKDIIIRGGENIPVVEVENMLYDHPHIKELAVVGIADERLGERGCAVLVTDGSPLTLRDITTYLDEHGMAKQYWPEYVVVVDQMPRTPSGKIQKFILKSEVPKLLNIESEN